MRNWRDISYLKHGDTRQQEVYDALLSSRALKLLAAFDPVVAGTYPIGIYLQDSDIDIICEYANPEHFSSVLNIAFSHYPHYEFMEKDIREFRSIIARFILSGFRFEIFGQGQAIERQYAYRHMLIEDNILRSKDEKFRREIIALKEKGLSTEEAFASLLGIDGDPYEGLLKLETRYSKRDTRYLSRNT